MRNLCFGLSFLFNTVGSFSVDQAAEYANEIFDWYAYDVAGATRLFPDVKEEMLTPEFLKTISGSLESVASDPDERPARVHLLNLMNKQLIKWNSSKGDIFQQNYNMLIFHGLEKLMIARPLHASLTELSILFRKVCVIAKTSRSLDVRTNLPQIAINLLESVIIRFHVFPSRDSYSLLVAFDAVVSNACMITEHTLGLLKGLSDHIRECTDDLGVSDCENLNDYALKILETLGV